MLPDFRAYILLLFICLLGFGASYTDIKKQQIKNKHIVLALLIGFLINASFLNLNFFINYAVNIAFAAVIGFVLWYVRFWNAGDGKLFLAFIALLPINLLYRNNFYLFSYDVIFYTFVPVFFVFFVLLLLQTKVKEAWNIFKRSFTLRAVSGIFLAFFSFQWIIGLVVKSTGISLNMFISILILFFVFQGLEKILPVRLTYILLITATLRLIFDYRNLTTTAFLYPFLIQFSVFLFVVYFILHLAYFKYGKHVKIQDLQPGMLLSELIVKKEDKYVVRPYVHISLFSFLRERAKTKAFVDIKPSGLTAEEIETLKKLNKEGKLTFGSVLIQKRLPYAPFQFLGVLIVAARALAIL